MTTGRINQVACRAARPGINRARTTRSATDRATTGAATGCLPPPKREEATDRRTERAGCSTCVRSVCYGLGSHARRSSGKIRARAAGTGRAAPKRDAPDPAHRESTPSRVAPAGHARRTAQKRQDTTPDRTRTALARQKSRPALSREPDNLSRALGKCGTTQSKVTPRLRPRDGHGVQGHPSHPSRRDATGARCTRWLAPDACDESRNRSHNSKMLRHARKDRHDLVECP